MAITIEDLKKHLGPGLGLRKSKYLIEIPAPSNKSKKINILCRSTSLPERNIGTVNVFNKGRRYSMRSETNYPGTYNISVTDDSEMHLRYFFDCWLTLVDNSNPGNQSPSSYESNCELNLGVFGESGLYPEYQTDINIWQLGNKGEKIYGYKLQNAFPSSLGTVELDDADETNLSEFSVTFTYSESIPLTPVVGNVSFNDNIVGKKPGEILKSINNLENHNDEILGSLKNITSEDLESAANGGLSGLIDISLNAIKNNTQTNLTPSTKPLTNSVSKKSVNLVKNNLLNF